MPCSQARWVMVSCNGFNGALDFVYIPAIAYILKLKMPISSTGGGRSGNGGLVSHRSERSEAVLFFSVLFSWIRVKFLV